MPPTPSLRGYAGNLRLRTAEVRSSSRGATGHLAAGWSTSVDVEERLPLQDLPDLLEGGADLASGVSDLADPRDVRELLAAILNNHNRPREAQSTLEQASLVNNVLPRLLAPIGHHIFCREHEKRDPRVVQHLGQPRNVRYAGDRHAIEFVPKADRDDPSRSPLV
jgi:hypothetical protein